MPIIPPNLRILDEKAEEAQQERMKEFHWGPSSFDEQVSDMKEALDSMAQTIAEQLRDGLKHPGAIEAEIISVV